jgi:hypothetical protein
MEIRQIQYFLSIVETGSFSAAADDPLHFPIFTIKNNHCP